MQPWGPIDIPAGRDGISASKNITTQRPSHLAYAESVSADRLLFEKMGGASRFNSIVMGGTVLAHHDFISSTDVQELAAYLDNGVDAAAFVSVDPTGVWATPKSNMSRTAFPWFVEGWTGTAKALFLFNGANVPVYYTGGGVAALDVEKASPDWQVFRPAAAAATRTRMFAWGNTNFPHTIYGSVPGVHQDFTGPESVGEIMFPGIGSKITAGKSYKQRFYVGKYPFGIVYLDESDPAPANWHRDIVTESIGLSGPGCWLDIVDDLLILSTDGYFYALSQVRTQGQTEVPPFMPQETSDFIKERINTDYLHLVRSVWYGHKRQAWFAVPQAESTTCDAYIIFDLNEQGNPKLFWSTRDDCVSLAMVKPSLTAVAKPSFGGAGYVWMLDQAARNKNGDGYTSQYETVPVAIMPGAVQRANLEELQVVMEPMGNWDLEIEVLRDGVPSQTIDYSMQTPGAGAGSISLDSDVVAGQTIATVRHKLHGDARYVKLIGRNENANENFAVASHIIRATPGNERQ